MPKPTRDIAGRLRRGLIRIFALAFAMQFLVGVFGIPHSLAVWLTGGREKSDVSPRYVFVLGGGGIPSESGLIRTYYAAHFGTTHTGMVFIVSLPSEGDPSTNSVGRMRDELVLRGIPRASVQMEFAALNTHEQAVNIAHMLGPGALTAQAKIITSPWHMRRALLCFRKAGFMHVTGIAAAGIGAEADAGPATGLRYGFWGNLKDAIDVARECSALLAYKLRGWL